MEAEILAIGDELASGQRLDTNSQWMAQRLGELGAPVKRHTTVADDLAANVEAFRRAVDRADVVVSTGGLGPTDDDLTRQSLAEAFDAPLVLDEAALDHIRRLFARRGRKMPEKNVVQAQFPTGSRPIANPHGTAPGIELLVPRDGRPDAMVFALPGVPAEMREMWSATVVPKLAAALGTSRRAVRHYCLRCFGAGESHIESMLPRLVRRGRVPSVGITASTGTITLRVTAAAAADEWEAVTGPTIATIRESLGDLIFGEEDDQLQHVVARLLCRRGETLATAEWDTGGLIGRWLSELPEAGAFYRGGLVQVPAGSLAPVLGLEAMADEGHTSPQHGHTAGQLGEAAGELTARALAMAAGGVRDRFGADWGLAAGRVVAPNAAGSETAPPQLCMALASADGVARHRVAYAAHPDILHAISAKHALNFLRLTMLRHAGRRR